jgi:hypothetical protein
MALPEKTFALGRHSESSQPPPPESATAIGRCHPTGDQLYSKLVEPVANGKSCRYRSI